MLSARLLLAAVFGVAGLAKLSDRAGARRALVDFGVPRALTTPLAILLPIAELAVALALLPLATAWIGAVGALVLLLLFASAIAFNLARGRTPDCHCFGQISSAPAGWSTLGRNLFLSLVAGLLVLQGPENTGASMVSWFGDLTIAQRALFVIAVAALALVAAEGWVLLQVLRQQGRLLLRLDAMEAGLRSSSVAVSPAANSVEETAAGLEVGAIAPTFRLKSMRGERETLQSLLSIGKPVLLFFTHPTCGPCKALMPEISRYQGQYASDLTIALVSEGSFKENRAVTSEHGVVRVLLQKAREVAEKYEAYGTPSAVLIRRDGTIGSRLAMGADAIRALVQRATNTLASGSAASASARENGNGTPGAWQDDSPRAIGEHAPPFKLPDLRGRDVDLETFRGRETLLLFWNPDCGFCQQMLGDLQEWERSASPGTPEIVLVSTGSVEDNAAMNLRSTVVIDADFEVAPAFGAGGTPMAVLLDREGRIASEVAAGAKAVFALAGATPSKASA